MNKRSVISGFLTICGAVAVCAALIGELLFTGMKETLITRIAGVTLIISSILSQRFTGVQSRAERRYALPERWRNMVSIVGILSALWMGYLIYFSGDNLPYRNVYLVVSATLVVTSFAASYFLPRFFAR